MDADPERLKLDQRIHRQRKRLHWFEKLDFERDTHWRRAALGYRRQLIEAGIKPNHVWHALYRKLKSE